MTSNKVLEKKKSKLKWFIILGFSIIAIYVGFKVFANNESSTTKYTLSSVETGNITNFLSSTGQVYVSDEYDVKSKVSSTVTSVLKKKGDSVKKGDIIIKLDSSDLNSQLKTAELNLAKARNAYEEAIAPIDDLTLAQAQSSLQNAKDNLEKLKSTQITTLAQAEKNKTNAEDSLGDSYISALNNIDTSFAGLSTITNDMRKILYLTDNLVSQDLENENTPVIDMNSFWNVEMPTYWSDIVNSTNFDSSTDKETFVNLIKKATASYKVSKNSYDKTVVNYRSLSKYSDKSVIESFLNDAIETNQYVSNALRDLNNVYNYWIDYNTQRHRTYYYSINTYNNTLKTHTNSINSYSTSLNNSKSNIVGAKNNLQNYSDTLENLKKTQPMDLVSAQNSLKIQEASYKKSIEGVTDLEKRSYQLAITQAQTSLEDIKKSIDSYVIKSPFDGIVAKMNVSSNDDIASGTSMATIISNQSLAQLTFNEVDVAKIKVGQKATLTFDAIDDLTMTGSVIDVDTIGTTSSGVVSYTVKIAFDTENSQIKPGMSVTANIILENKTNVVIVPNSAIKTSNNVSYVEVFENNTKAIAGATIESEKSPTKKTIEVGLTDDSNSEVTSGLSEGDVIVTKTVKTTTTKKTTGTSLLQTTRQSSTSNTKSSSSSSTKSSSSSSSDVMGPPPGGF